MAEDFYHFEGNAQALRLVSKLHFLVDENGMNLTYALLGTIIKYPVSSLEVDRDSGDIRTQKMGYYLADREIYEEIERETGTDGARHPLAFILEAADDIAYKTADIEDAFVKGFVQLCETSERASGAGRTGGRLPCGGKAGGVLPERPGKKACPIRKNMR